MINYTGQVASDTAAYCRHVVYAVPERGCPSTEDPKAISRQSTDCRGSASLWHLVSCEMK